MMKREEAVYELQSCVDAWDKWTLPSCSSMDKYKEAVKMSLAALRGPTREQVEKMRGVWTGNFNAHCSLCDAFSTMEYIGQGGNFCSACGAPMTDEAVDILMKRLEALKDGTTD